MFLEDSQIFHLQFLKIEDYIQNFCHKFHIHNFYEPYTELRSEKFIFSIYSSIFHSQSWKTACFPALGQENRFSDLQTMNFFFSAWNENSTIIKEISIDCHLYVLRLMKRIPKFGCNPKILSFDNPGSYSVFYTLNTSFLIL